MMQEVKPKAICNGKKWVSTICTETSHKRFHCMQAPTKPALTCLSYINLMCVSISLLFPTASQTGWSSRNHCCRRMKRQRIFKHPLWRQQWRWIVLLRCHFLFFFCNHNWIRLWRRERCYLQSIEQIPDFHPIPGILSTEELISRNQHNPSW